MPYANQLLGTGRRRLMAVLLATVAAIVLLLAFQGPAARAEGGCISNRACTWTGTFYNGTEYNNGCGGPTFFEGIELKSAKNRCSVNIHIGWEIAPESFTTWKACMSPGGERPEPGRFNVVVPGGC